MDNNNKQSMKQLEEEEEVIDLLSSPSSTEKDSPIRSIFCLKAKIDNMEPIDEVEDCFILDFDPSIPFKQLTLNSSSNQDDDQDLYVIAEKGQVACRDYPHSRHLCTKNPFDKTPHDNYCEMCYCYVCDVAAPCKFWTLSATLSAAAAHCHASDSSTTWICLRRANIKEDSTYNKAD
ncbi:hypothetical protein ACFE04_018232 [Oxalis oulophora]